MCISIVITPTPTSSLVWNENDIVPQPPPPTHHETFRPDLGIVQGRDFIWKLKIIKNNIKDNIKDNFKDEFKHNLKDKFRDKFKDNLKNNFLLL